MWLVDNHLGEFLQLSWMMAQFRPATAGWSKIYCLVDEAQKLR
jgi:hypothetical protein